MLPHDVDGRPQDKTTLNVTLIACNKTAADQRMQ